MNEKLKMYVPSGNLEKFVLGLIDGAGFEPEKSDRGYVINTNSDVWEFKQIKARDQPYMVAKGRGDLCIVGEDIFEEFGLGYPDLNKNLEILDYFKGRPTKLVAVVSKEKYEDINTLEEFFDVNGSSINIAAEYPNIVKDYVFRNYGIDIDAYKPAGKTEATLTGSRSEMDLIFDTTETGNTINANGGKIIETLLESKQVAVINTEAYNNSVQKYEIDNLMEQFRGVMRAKTNNLKKFQANVLMDDDVDSVTSYLLNLGYTPTVSKLYPTGADVCVIIPNREIKDISPAISNLGGSDIIITAVERFLYSNK